MAPDTNHALVAADWLLSLVRWCFHELGRLRAVAYPKCLYNVSASQENAFFATYTAFSIFGKNDHV
jgi:hypothetical protein